MDERSRSERLLMDAISRVLVSPVASSGWHALTDAYHAVDNAQARLHARMTMSTEAPTGGIEGFLRATFLSSLEDGLPHVATAGQLIQAIKPVDTDRLLAFAIYEWGRAVAEGGDRRRFVAQLRAARLPEVVALAGRELQRSRPALSPRSIAKIRRVALVTPFLGSAGHPPTILALKQAALLQAAGVDVEAFVCQEPLIPDMGAHLGNCGAVVASAPDIARLAALAPAGLAVHLADPAYSLLHRWRETLRAIERFDPDLIVFVGLFSPLTAPLYAGRPVLGLCVHSVAPMAPVDAWLTSDAKLANRTTAPWGDALPPGWGVQHPFRVSLRPISAPIGRAQLEVAEGARVMITVGARLDEEIDGEWAARMVAFVSVRPDLVWVLVGGTGERPTALSALPEAQLRLAPHQEDLRSVLRCCDLYANPVRIGGGFSVAEAMGEGLAVCALADSDGGDKLGPHAMGDLDDYFRRLAELADDEAARRRFGDVLRTRFFETLDLDRSGSSLLAACDIALRRFRRRTA